eukprot:TRINITY_DN2281_c0_g1_i1.p1 TRINITY_DN2281_c0_g1~~TRINITY_DN2281_c0_g1_i1.p1  ORF type:complete len:306 (+),score=30.95 TRINITY_DN2281_c0_g1_i1:89-1006(+)
MLISCQARANTLRAELGSIITHINQLQGIKSLEGVPYEANGCEAALRPATLNPEDLQEREDVLDPRLGCDRAIWFVVAGWIFWSLTDLDILHLSIVYDKHKALASDVTKRFLWTLVKHGHADFPSKPAAGVCKEPDHRAFHLLILCPRLHDGTIVHAVNEHLVNTLRLQLSSLAQIARNLHGGSAWCESTWETKDDDLLALRGFGHVHLPNGIEALVDGDCRDFVSDFDDLGLLLRLRLLLLGSDLECLGAQALTAHPLIVALIARVRDLHGSSCSARRLRDLSDFDRVPGTIRLCLATHALLES